MFNTLKIWYQRYFGDPQAVILFVLLVFGFIIIATMGQMLAPVFAAWIFAYLLDGIVTWLIRHKTPRLLAVNIAFSLFIGGMFFCVFSFLPLVWQQLSHFFVQFPEIVLKGQALLAMLLKRFPEYLSPDQILSLTTVAEEQIAHYSKTLLAVTLSSLPSVMAWLVYLVLVPLLVFFMLKDKETLLTWLASRLPPERHAANRVWEEMNRQLANYVRGKVVEILIVGIVTYLVLIAFGLPYAALLGFLVGLSVLIPYVGVVVVTIPVALIGFTEWGWGAQYAYMLIAYGIVQGLDGAVLVPLLFSEAVNLHPIVIILAVLVFGGLWGFWGIFFAIPLATLVKAVMNAWPR